ncbi:hypothetical protein SAMN04487894_101517 [Niabella drilacis]|uniref:Uncharacterized protein n=1 Tax=Niabella drilacis (strain DSM 25811 / CCM 8410 / CCUG 62505 / LMG 26954 / E90) TaxID=1285928 RepID=A0A1G6JF66_NIADE|nr:hypothetical protein SAMN04487894_101517 [Niabella drilacis]
MVPRTAFFTLPGNDIKWVLFVVMGFWHIDVKKSVNLQEGRFSPWEYKSQGSSGDRFLTPKHCLI